MAGELLLFPGDVYGMVLNLEEEHVGAVLMGSDAGIKAVSYTHLDVYKRQVLRPIL